MAISLKLTGKLKKFSNVGNAVTAVTPTLLSTFGAGLLSIS